MDKTDKKMTEMLELPYDDYVMLRVIATMNNTTPADLVHRFISVHLGDLPPVDPR